MILLIGGTSETAPLAVGLARAGYAVLVSTATETPLAIGDHPRISRRSGRLDEEGLVALGREKGIKAIVDAAHPYAVAAHRAAQGAAVRLGIPCLAFRRAAALPFGRGRLPGALLANGAAPAPSGERPGPSEGITTPAGTHIAGIPDDLLLFAADHAEAAQIAFADGRPVLLTTGSRNLTPYVQASRRTSVPLAVRILDAPESLSACRAAGIPDERIITGRGPFSREENIAAIGHFSAGVMVTKESGIAGGIEAKLAAAGQARCRVIVIGRPETPSGAPAFDQPSTLIAALQDLVPSRAGRRT